MTDMETQPIPEDEPATALPSVVGRVVGYIDRVLSPGDRSALRRMHPSAEMPPAFWKLAARTLMNGQQLPEAFAGDRISRRERAWATLCHAIALSDGLHAPGARLGTALFQAGLSEARLLRLLRSHDEGLLDQVSLLARYLGTRRTPTDMTDLARLVLSDGGEHEEGVRRQIASDYYRAEAKAAH